ATGSGSSSPSDTLQQRQQQQQHPKELFSADDNLDPRLQPLPTTGLTCLTGLRLSNSAAHRLLLLGSGAIRYRQTDRSGSPGRDDDSQGFPGAGTICGLGSASSSNSSLFSSSSSTSSSNFNSASVTAVTATAAFAAGQASRSLVELRCRGRGGSGASVLPFLQANGFASRRIIYSNLAARISAATKSLISASTAVMPVKSGLGTVGYKSGINL
ncbi:unnamed protein product, partial [Protopolystoma xenopodis]